MEDRWGTPPPAEDRLSALRAPSAGTVPAPTGGRGKRRNWREIVLGLALVLVGCMVALFVVDRAGTGVPSAVDPVPTSAAGQPGRPGKGMALFAALVEAGAYPPAIRQGDTVMVVVRPEPSSDSVTRALPDLATVTAVSDASTISGGVVVSMIGPESMSREVADAARVHLSVVRSGK